MPTDVTKHYRWKRERPVSSCSPASLRVIHSGRGLVRVCCPKGHYNRKTKRCRVGTRAQAIARKR